MFLRTQSRRHGKIQARFTMLYHLNMTSMQIIVAHKEILSKLSKNYQKNIGDI